MKVLVDINVFEDIYRQRAGWETSLIILNHVRSGRIEGYVSALTPPVLYFFRKRTLSEPLSRRTVRQALVSFKIIPIGEDTLEAAFNSSLPDFEDCIQFECAKSAAVDHIVTRNKRHFRQAAIAVSTPEEILKEIM